MKSVLMIAFYFPPLGGPGVRRPVKFVKYLPEFGWRPVVLSALSWNARVLDESLYRELPERLKIYRSRIIEHGFVHSLIRKTKPGDIILRYLDSLLLFPDNRIGWLPFAYKKGLEAIRKEKIDAIYSTSGPYTAHLVGYLLKRKTGLPWIVDLRDEWLEDPYLTFRTPLHYLAMRRLEKMILASADKVITTSDPITDLVNRKVQQKEKCLTITNGFDERDSSANAPITGRSKFVITYTGSMHKEIDADPFFRAVKMILEKGLIEKDHLSVRFIGQSPNERLVGELGLQGVVNIRPYVSHSEAVAALSEATVLLLILAGWRGDRIIPEKTFEYLGAGKPILAMVPPDGAAAKLLVKTRTGAVVPPEDVGLIGETILKYYDLWRAGKALFSPDRVAVTSFTRRNLAKALDDCLNEVTGNMPEEPLHPEIVSHWVAN